MKLDLPTLFLLLLANTTRSKHYWTTRNGYLCGCYRKAWNSIKPLFRRLIEGVCNFPSASRRDNKKTKQRQIKPSSTLCVTKVSSQYTFDSHIRKLFWEIIPNLTVPAVVSKHSCTTITPPYSHAHTTRCANFLMHALDRLELNGYILVKWWWLVGQHAMWYFVCVDII